MLILRYVCLFFLLGMLDARVLLAADNSQAPSFDCKKAISQVDRLVCTEIVHSLGPLDATMATAYRAALQQSQNKDQFLAEHREWLASRSTKCSVPKDIDASYRRRSLAALCMKGLYAERIAELRQEAGEADPFAQVSEYRMGAVPVQADSAARLISAARWNDLLTLRRLLAQGERSRLSEALYSAAHQGSAAATRELIDAGANVNEAIIWDPKTGEGSTALRVAARLDNRNVVALLLSRGADISVDVKDDMPLLTLAVRTGRLDLVTFVLKETPDLNEHNTGMYSWDRKGPTALMVAVQSGYPELVKALLDAGADPNAQGMDGETALQIASYDSEFGAEMAANLIAHRADVNSKTGQHGPAIVSAANIAIARVLLDAGADVNDVDFQNSTLLHYAAKKCDSEFIEFVLARGGNKSAQDRYGHTPKDVMNSYFKTGKCPRSKWPKTMRKG